MLLRKFEMPWRTTYEGYAATAWLVCILGLLTVKKTAVVPSLPFSVLMGLSLLFFLSNGLKSWQILKLKFALSGKGLEYVRDTALTDYVRKGSKHLFLGKGFRWTPIHTQRAYEIKRADPRKFYPPRALMALRELLTGQTVGALHEGTIGLPWIHGLEPNEEDIEVPISNFVGNTLVLGVNRCGKTRILEEILHQAIVMGITVISIDPKGDQALHETIRLACNAAGREKDYCQFDLARPLESVRLDVLKNYSDRTDLASRVAALMGGGERNESFRAFAWDVVNSVVAGIHYVGEPITLVQVRRYIDGGVADLLMRVVRKHFDDTLEPGWEALVRQYASTLKVAKGQKNEEGDINPRDSLNLCLSYYFSVLSQNGHFNESLQGLASIYKHDASHYSKMLASLKPILSQLTSGELGHLLSPDATNIDDDRPMSDLQSIVRTNGVLSIGLNSLANKEISSCVGAMLLSDLTSVVSAVYNFSLPQPVLLVVDEAAEVVNEPFISLLNKGGGAGLMTVAAAQTVPDFFARFGSEHNGRQMLGNFNNLIALRTKDEVTQKFIVETLGETYVHQKQVIIGTTSSTEKTITHFTGGIQERVTEQLEEVFPQDLTGCLPNWEYIASFSGGDLRKGRVPIIHHGD